MVKTVARRDCCCSRVEGTLQRSGARAFIIHVLRELGKGIAVWAKERRCSLQNWTARRLVKSFLAFVAGVEEIKQFRLQTAIATRKETRARYQLRAQNGRVCRIASTMWMGALETSGLKFGFMPQWFAACATRKSTPRLGASSACVFMRRWMNAMVPSQLKWRFGSTCVIVIG
jgi:hypothetical protein